MMMIFTKATSLRSVNSQDDKTQVFGNVRGFNE